MKFFSLYLTHISILSLLSWDMVGSSAKTPKYFLCHTFVEILAMAFEFGFFDLDWSIV